MAKTRVKPMGNTTIPRMELLGAVSAVQMANYIEQALNGTLTLNNRTLWIDSQIVIHWTQGNRKLPTYVQNRVERIRHFAGDIRYVPSKENPADLLTRGITPDELHHSDLWWSGPNWLNGGNPPSTPPPDVIDETVLLQQAHAAADDDAIHDANDKVEPATADLPVPNIANMININSFNSFGKLLRVTALTQRSVRLWRRKEKITREQLTDIDAQAINTAEKTWIRSVQEANYRNEIDLLQGNPAAGPHPVRSKTRIKQLRLFLDDDKLIRINGRLTNAPIAADAKCPYLLPNKDKFAAYINHCVLPGHLGHLMYFVK
ncbi:uncharacterized protein LOC135492978 [Lineus longissimus]|uniref:uncharacterized protein LOC135492978 n=1 Tax=Lineus longissimus TaxID=88925 RepID=UPI00315C88F4